MPSGRAPSRRGPRAWQEESDSARMHPRYTPLSAALLRAPLLSIEDYRALCDASPAERRLRALHDARIHEALTVGAGELVAALGRPGGSARDEQRIDAKLLRYLIRMSTRSTPYGLFAGVALSHWGPATDAQIGLAPRRTRTRVDMEWLMRWLTALESRLEVRRGLRVVANTVAFVRAGRLYLPEHARGEGPGGAAEVSVRNTPLVRCALGAAREPIAYEDLVQLLLESTSRASRARVEELLTALWAQTFLLTDLRPPLTTDDPVAHVLHRLDGIPQAAAARDELQAVADAATQWDAERASAGAEGYHAIGSRAAGAGVVAASPLQVDSALTLRGSCIVAAVGAEAARAAELLIRLSPFPRGAPHLAVYRHAVEERYGPRREVPLLELLDPELGLGSPESYRSSGHDETRRQSTAREQTLIDLAAQALRDRCWSVELDDDTVSRLASRPVALENAPSSLDISIIVAARSAAAIDEGEFRVIIGPNLGAQCAGRNLGRFAGLLGSETIAVLREVRCAETSASPHFCDAELVYLPGGRRSANVAIRPRIHDYEVVFGATPGVPPDHIIPLDELAVAVRQEKFVIRWRTADLFVQVHEGHMLHTHEVPAAVRFLADVSRDGKTEFMPFDWGPAERFPALPRVTSGRIVLRPAQWHVSARTCAEWSWMRSASPSRDAIDRWRTTWQVPRFVHLGYGDNRLLLDLECPSHIAQLCEEVRRLDANDQLTIQEALPAPDENWLVGPDGHYVAELVVPLAQRRKITADAGPPARAPAEPATAVTRVPLGADASLPDVSRARLKPPGSEWLYAKVYEIGRASCRERV